MVLVDRRVLIFLVVVLVGLVVLSLSFYGFKVYKDKGKVDLVLVEDFEQAFLSFLKGDKRALDDYRYISGVDSFVSDLLFRESQDLDLFEYFGFRDELPLDYGQAPAVVEDEGLVLVGDEGVEGNLEFLLDQGYDFTLIDVVGIGEDVKAFLKVDNLTLTSKTQDIFFAGTYYQLDRNQFSISYDSLVEKDIYKTLRKTGQFIGEFEVTLRFESMYESGFMVRLLFDKKLGLVDVEIVERM